MKGAWVRSALVLITLVLSTLALLPATVAAQSDADRVMAAIRAAMAPALPFPATDDSGAVPANGDTVALWMVRPLQPGDRSIEISANPLNTANQLRAARAMAQIENNIEAAQRRAAAQYDRAVSEAKRTGRSQEVDGVTLADEGVAGARIDAESHVLIDLAYNEPSFSVDIETSIQPAPSTVVSIPGAVAVIAVPSNTYRDGPTNSERFAEATTMVFLGKTATPDVRKQADNRFGVVTSAESPSLVIRLRGNEVLIADLLRKTNWTQLLELMK
jgi:hypothetical protein